MGTAYLGGVRWATGKPILLLHSFRELPRVGPCTESRKVIRDRCRSCSGDSTRKGHKHHLYHLQQGSGGGESFNFMETIIIKHIEYARPLAEIPVLL